jgi:hypothetical protein
MNRSASRRRAYSRHWRRDTSTVPAKPVPRTPVCIWGLCYCAQRLELYRLKKGSTLLFHPGRIGSNLHHISPCTSSSQAGFRPVIRACAFVISPWPGALRYPIGRYACCAATARRSSAVSVGSAPAFDSVLGTETRDRRRVDRRVCRAR